MGGVTGSRAGRLGGARRRVGGALVFGGGLAAACLLFGVASASALVPGDAAEISGSYSTYASTSSSDPNFAPCTALPGPEETFWAFVNGNEHISNTFRGLCSFTSSPDPNQAGVTDYALTYHWEANWAIVVNDSDVGTTMTLTMSFDTMDNVVATKTYQITAPPTTTDATTVSTSATTTTTPPATTTEPTTTASDPPVGTPTSTLTVPAPPSPTTSVATTTEPVTTAPSPSNSKAAVITTSSTIRTKISGGVVAVTIKTNSTRKSFLCYRRAKAGKTRCVSGYGTWRVRLPATRHSTIKRLFVIKVAAATVAQKTITIQVA